jgi:hypothetical protein
VINQASVPALAPERRKHFRAFPRFSLTVKVRVQYSLGIARVELTGTSVNIGLGGICVSLNRPLVSKERVWLQFVVPGTPLPLRILSKLRHLDKGQYGFQFLSTTAEEREAIRSRSEKLPML